MTQFRRWLYLGLVLLGTQLSAGCYLGYTNRPVLFPGIALSPTYARPGSPCSCGTSCYREFGPSGCGGSLFSGPLAGAGPVVTGPVYDAPPIAVSAPVGGYDVPMYSGGYPAPAATPGCVGCGAKAGYSGIPIAGALGGPPIAVTTTGGSTGPIYGMPYDSGAVPTLKPPAGSIPLQMPSEMKESKKISVAGK